LLQANTRSAQSLLKLKFCFVWEVFFAFGVGVENGSAGFVASLTAGFAVGRLCRSSPFQTRAWR
jgi:hypothetical protein